MYDYLIRDHFFLNNELFGHTAGTGYTIQCSITIQANHYINLMIALCDQNMSNLHESMAYVVIRPIICEALLPVCLSTHSPTDPPTHQPTLPPSLPPTHSSTYLPTYSPCGPCPLFQFLNLYTVGGTPWMGDQPVARPLPTHRTIIQNNRAQTSKPRVEFEPTILVFGRTKPDHALDRAATVYIHTYIGV
jgi:hypothetical protein